MFQEMKYVLEVYRHGSFSKAAKALYISQPSLSLMVKKAENRIGGLIFDRSTSPISLTEAGMIYIESALQVTDIQDNLVESLNSLTNCLSGHLSVGGTTLFTSFVLPPILTRFTEIYPGISLTVRESNSVQLLKEVQSGSLDMIIDNTFFDSGEIDCYPYRKETMILAVPRKAEINKKLSSYALTAKEISEDTKKEIQLISLREFSEEPFLLLKAGNDSRSRADEMMRETGIHPNIRLELDQQITAYHLAAYGMGVTLISDTLVRHTAPDDRLVFYYIDNPQTERFINLYCKRKRNISSAEKAFFQQMGISVQQHWA